MPATIHAQGALMDLVAVGDAIFLLGIALSLILLISGFWWVISGSLPDSREEAAIEMRPSLRRHALRMQAAMGDTKPQ
ncbi:MAG: hypothetical protein JOZ85_00555 [Betaproteobacteria bacterium]|nr:hypothetical protein [Betaproteobacteria bacterium]